MTSECGVPACELVSEGGEDVLEFLSVEVVPGAEEACTEAPGFRYHFGERLGDRRLSGSCHPVEPEDVLFLWIVGLLHDAFEDSFSSPAEAGIVMAGLVSRASHGTQIPQQFQIRGFLMTISVYNSPSISLETPHDDVSGSFVDPFRVCMNALLNRCLDKR